jgi:hypothetical protein
MPVGEPLTIEERLKLLEAVARANVPLERLPLLDLQKSMIDNWNPHGFDLVLPASVREKQIYTPPVNAPTFQNGWGHLGGGTLPVGYYRGPDGRIHLQGDAAGGVVGAAIFTLPAGFRPAAQADFATVSGGALCQLSVTAAGVVLQAVGGAAAYQTLDGVSFRAA